MTSATTPKTIDLGGASVQRESVAGATIRPGMLIARSGADNVIPHGVADGPAQPAFAVEYDLTGRGIDDVYAEGDQVIFRVFAQGAGVYALLNTGVSATAGVALASAGNGSLKLAVGGDNVVAIARETVNAVGSPARIRVEVAGGFGV